MLFIHDKEAVKRALGHSQDIKGNLPARLAYLATYGMDGTVVHLRPDTMLGEHAFSVAWFNSSGDNVMTGGLVLHDGVWGVHT